MSPLQQNYIIFRDANMFYARGQIDGTTLASGVNAVEIMQTAVDIMAADGGGEVFISRGEYPLSTTLQLTNNIRLRGSGRGTRLLAQSAIGISGTGLKGAQVENLSLHGAGASAGLILDDSGDCLIQNVLCQGFRDYGFWVRNNTFLSRLQGCIAADNGKANIYLDKLAGGGRGGDFVPNVVANCITYGGGTGIESNHVIVLNIVGCAVFQPAEYGYYLHHTSNSVLISGCRTFQVEQDAIRVESTHELNVTGNIFCWHRGDGIVLHDVSWGAINGNEVIDSGVRAHDGKFTMGIVLSANTQGVQVTGNTIFNWGDQVPMQNGIIEDASCQNNIIASNNINYYTGVAVDAAGQNTLVEHNMSEKETAYQGMGRQGYPDYDRERITQFIAI